MSDSQMTQIDCCHQLLAEISAKVAATLPPGRTRALLALLDAGDTIALVGDPARAERLVLRHGSFDASLVLR